MSFHGRGERIWTSGLYVPNVALYQTEPHLDITASVFRGCWQRYQDLNPDKQSQSLLCYHYTIPLYSFYWPVFPDNVDYYSRYFSEVNPFFKKTFKISKLVLFCHGVQRTLKKRPEAPAHAAVRQPAHRQVIIIFSCDPIQRKAVKRKPFLPLRMRFIA